MDAKFAVFLDLARKMNGKFSIIPLLYGSMGLQRQIEDDLCPDDIDICVPQHLYHFDQRWPDLLAFMQGEGYELINLNEHVFQKGETCVNIGVIDGIKADTIPSIEAFTGIDPMDIPIVQTDGAIYKLLTLEQYYKVYSTSILDNYRNGDDDRKDEKKVEILERLLHSPKQA